LLQKGDVIIYCSEVVQKGIPVFNLLEVVTDISVLAALLTTSRSFIPAKH